MANKLLTDLTELGSKLAEEHLPDPSTVRQVVGGLVHYIETGGSLEPPVAAVEHAVEGAVEETADETIARLESELAAARGETPAATETPEEKAARLERELAAARGTGS